MALNSIDQFYPIHVYLVSLSQISLYEQPSHVNEKKNREKSKFKILKNNKMDWGYGGQVVFSPDLALIRLTVSENGFYGWTDDRRTDSRVTTVLSSAVQ